MVDLIPIRILIPQLRYGNTAPTETVGLSGFAVTLLVRIDARVRLRALRYVGGGRNRARKMIRGTGEWKRIIAEVILATETRLRTKADVLDFVVVIALLYISPRLSRLPLKPVTLRIGDGELRIED